MVEVSNICSTSLSKNHRKLPILLKNEKVSCQLFKTVEASTLLHALYESLYSFLKISHYPITNRPNFAEAKTEAGRSRTLPKVTSY